MAGRNDIGLAPAGTPVRVEYERDFYSWLMEQARFVRDGRWDAVDRANLAEEIESLGREQFNKLESALWVLLMHLLKWDYQPEKRTRSWTLSVKEQRLRLQHVLDDNPGLKSRFDEALTRAYELACVQAANETGLAEATFPAACPYGETDIVSREIRIDEARS